MRRITLICAIEVFFLLLSSVSTVKADPVTISQRYEDPGGDLLDSGGRYLSSGTQDTYLDIVSVNFSRRYDSATKSQDFVITMVLLGTLPTSVVSPQLIEWLIGFDMDQNVRTGWNVPVFENDLGVDYQLKYFVSASTRNSQLVQWLPGGATTNLGSPYYKVEGNRITWYLTFPPTVSVPARISWMALARRYQSQGPPATNMLVADKTPNIGHYESYMESLEIIKTTVTPATTTSQPSTPFLGFLDMSRLQQIGGVAATGGVAVFGWFLKTRKRRFVSAYLMKIDSTYNQYSMNREECRKLLSQMKEESVQLLRKGKIDEPHFTLVDNKLTAYLKEIA